MGHAASAVVDAGHRWIRTQTLARYEQARSTTKREPAARFENLSRDPFGTLEGIREAMVGYAADWQERLIDRNERGLTPQELVECEKDLTAFRDEESRFAAGLAALVADEKLLDAFIGMNEIFRRTSADRGYDRWRLFQIVFIVTQLPALAIREGTTEGSWPEGVDRSWGDVLDWGDVLWFPTGGGKTEAYLGLISCAALYDRLRGKRFGVTAWLRFPLRMLSVQQLQRAATVLWETEMQRQMLLGEESEDSDPISLGYFVGGGSTPNTIYTGSRGRWSYGRLEQDGSLREKLLLVSDCPSCRGERTVGIVVDSEAHRIRHVCSRCSTELPVYVSDEEVYRFLPTVLVGTVDKMAAVAWNPKFSMLWGGAAWKCPEHDEHGYGLGDFCVYGCPTNPRRGRSYASRRQVVSPYDPAPSFHIQDELHLLQEELGAFAGHYETLVRSCEMAAGDGLPPKTVAATATIEGFEHQVRHVYGVPNARRFPGRGFDRLESFYATPDADPDNEEGNPKTARIYVAFRPPNMHAADAASLCARLIHEEIGRLHENLYEAAAWLPNARTEEEVGALLRYYDTTLTYVGSKTRGLRVRQSLEREAGRLRPGGSRDLATEFLSGDSSLAEIADTVRRVESPPGWEEEGHLDATVATSVISHGVDVERFNLMVMDGIPEETADYIQASSRSGRRHVGLIVAVLASYSLRASSIYHRFNEYHAHLDRLVSPVPVNRFAKYAAHRTASGVLVGLLYGRYAAVAKTDNLKKRNVAAQLISPSERTNLPFQVAPVELLHHVEAAYAVSEGIYPEGLELAIREILRDQTRRFIHVVRGSRKEKIADAVRPAPMTSLRDVDAGVSFQPASNTDWQELEHFRRA
ncbi:MAG TPA: helicase-related protein [Rubrobacter sp.]|nr:helicase-related protein [Rubrobacter sp.]